jgi:hypothetical protein
MLFIFPKTLIGPIRDGVTFIVSTPKDTNGHFEVIKSSTIRNSFSIARAIVNKNLHSLNPL